MIITLIGIGIMTILLFLLGFVPVATSLPFGIDGALFTVGQWILHIRTVLWPLDIVFTIFFKVYVPFLVCLMILKFFLWHRVPGKADF